MLLLATPEEMEEGVLRMPLGAMGVLNTSDMVALTLNSTTAQTSKLCPLSVETTLKLKALNHELFSASDFLSSSGVPRIFLSISLMSSPWALMAF